MITYTCPEQAEKVDCLIVPVWEDKNFDSYTKALDAAHDGLLSHVKKAKDFEGKAMQTSLLYTSDKKLPRLFLIGLGKKKEFNIRTWKHTIGSAVLAMQSKKWKKLALALPKDAIKKLGSKKIGSETVIAVETANYSFDDNKDKKSQVKPVSSVQFVGDFDSKTKSAILKGKNEGKGIASAVTLTRHLGNVPPSIMTPTLLAKYATELSKEYTKVKTKVLSRPEIKKLGMGCFLGVSQGSVEEPKFIIVEYNGTAKKQKPTVLVGKGITFDSGGLSLKPGAYMPDMKFDMLGAATVLGSIKAAAALGLKKNIIGLLPSCENMPSGSSYRPDDILINMEGKSVLIDNTDAEGRLILSDALSYAKKYKPKEVIDFATLTGACVVAVGNERSGLFSKEEKMISKLQKSSKEVGEQLWHLPLGPEFSEAMKCEIADIKNTGNVGGRGYGGASTAAAFLEFFTKDKEGKSAYPWAHIDLSCSYYGGKGKSYIRSGANGFGVQTMVEYLRN